MATTPAYPSLSQVACQGTTNAKVKSNVKALQCLLNYRNGNTALLDDGDFGNLTTTAVKNYQSNNGLVADGMAGPLTLSKLAVNVKSVVTNSAARGVQHLLSKFESIVIDSNFGPIADGIAKSFQGKMGLLQDGLIGAISWQFLFGYNAYPTGGSSSSMKNTNYAGVQVLTTAQLSLLNANRLIYEQAGINNNVPWQILAAIHYREYGLQKSGPSYGNGPYQIWGKSYPVGAYTDAQFLKASNEAAQFIRSKVGNLSLATLDNVKYTFFAYNGIANVYKTQAANLGFTSAQANNGEGSPYVMNRYDARRDPAVAPTKTNNTWGQYKVDGVWPGTPGNANYVYPANSDFGAFVAYNVICTM